MSSIYYGVMTAIALVVIFVGMAGGAGRQRWQTLVGGLALAAIIALRGGRAGRLAVLAMQQDEGFARNLYEARRQEASSRATCRCPRRT